MECHAERRANQLLEDMCQTDSHIAVQVMLAQSFYHASQCVSDNLDGGRHQMAAITAATLQDIKGSMF